MKNQTGQGPTEQNKATERMAQERASPGATSAGGHATEAPGNDTRRLDPTLAEAGAPDTSARTAARRGPPLEAAADGDDPNADPGTPPSP